VHKMQWNFQALYTIALDWSRWFVIGSLPLFVVPNFMFTSGDGELVSKMSWM
jgi:hypothetical protein